MPHAYYELFRSGHTRWTLGSIYDASGNEIDCRMFEFQHRQVNKVPATLEIYAPGEALDFSFIDTVPVVRRHVADLLSATCAEDIERFPVRIQGDSGAWDIIKVVPLIDCIDPDRSLMMTTWTPPIPGDALYAEPSDPQYTPYGGMLQVMIDPAKVGSAKVFRPKYWGVVVIARDDVIQALHDARVTGFGVRLVN